MASKLFTVLLPRRACRLALHILLVAGLIAAAVHGQEAASNGRLVVGDLRLEEGGLIAKLELQGIGGGLSGLQFDVQAAGADLRVEGALVERAQRNGKVLYVREVEPGVHRFVVVGFNQNRLEAGALAVLTFPGLKMSGPAAGSILVRRVIGTDGEGRRIELAVRQRISRDEGLYGDRERKPRRP